MTSTEGMMKQFGSVIEDRIRKIGPGKAFILEDLFGASEWDELSDTEKKVLGKGFYAAVRIPPFENVCPTDYPMKPAQQYVRFEPRKRSK